MLSQMYHLSVTSPVTLKSLVNIKSDSLSLILSQVSDRFPSQDTDYLDILWTLSS
jgi:hypothetical protein